MTAGFDVDRLAHLEEERDFLLRSLDDLERERDEGNLAPEEYERLRDDYTARTAAVLRAIRDGLDARPVAPPVPLRRRIAVGVGIGAFAVAAALLLARSLGERLPGQTVTGNDQLGGSARGEVCPVGRGDLDDLERAAERSAADRLAYAGALVEAGRAPEGLRQYDEVLAGDPANAASLVCSAQVVFGAGLIDDALVRLDAAVDADPSFAPAYYVRGLLRFQADGDAEGALVDLRRYRRLDPGGPFTAEAATAIEEIRRRAGQSTRQPDPEDPVTEDPATEDPDKEP